MVKEREIRATKHWRQLLEAPTHVARRPSWREGAACSSQFSNSEILTLHCGCVSERLKVRRKFSASSQQNRLCRGRFGTVVLAVLFMLDRSLERWTGMTTVSNGKGGLPAKCFVAVIEYESAAVYQQKPGQSACARNGPPLINATAGFKRLLFISLLTCSVGISFRDLQVSF